MPSHVHSFLPFFLSFIHSFIHSLLFSLSLCRSFSRSFIHSLTQSLTHSLTHLLIHLLIWCLIRPWLCQFIHFMFFHWHLHPFAHSLVHLSKCSLLLHLANIPIDHWFLIFIGLLRNFCPGTAGHYLVFFYMCNYCINIPCIKRWGKIMCLCLLHLYHTVVAAFESQTQDPAIPPGMMVAFRSVCLGGWCPRKSPGASLGIRWNMSN